MFCDSPVGCIRIEIKNNQIVGIEFAEPVGHEIMSPLPEELSDYFDFGVVPTLKLKGTEFQVKVWEQLQKIPVGETRTYGQVAVAIDKPKAYRSVASACKANKIAILIPCHRVVGVRNKMAYKWGSDKKEALLKLEADMI